MSDNKKNYTIEEIKELINKKINNEELEDDDVLYYEEAQEILKKHLKNDPNNKELLFLLALVQYEDSYINDEYKKVITTLEKLLNLNYKKDKVLYYLASSYYRYCYYNDYEKIIQLLENAIELNNEDSEYWYSLGDVHFNIKKDYNKALYYYKKAAEINYTETIHNHKKDYYYRLGQINLYLGNSKEAIENFTKSINISSEEYFLSQILHYLGLSYEKNGQYDEALKSYKKALDINVRSELDDYFYKKFYTIKSLYDLYKRLGKNDDALYALKDSIEKDISAPFMIIPDDDKNFKSETYNDIVHAYTDIIKYCYYSKYTFVNELSDLYKEAAYREMLAYLYKRYGEYYKAIELYNQISIENYKNIAETYRECKNYDKAIDIYKMLIEIYPDNKLNYYIDIAHIYEEAKNYEEVINYYNEAIEICDTIYYFKEIAYAYEKLEKYDEAIKFYKKQIEIIESYGIDGTDKLHEELMNSYMKLGDKQKVIETIKNRNLISFDNISIYYKKIIDAYAKLGDRQKAIETYNSMIECYEKNTDEDKDYYQFLKYLRDLYLKFDDKEKSAETYNFIIECYEKNIDEDKDYYQFLKHLGDLHLKFDDKENALKTYNKSIELCIKKIEDLKNENALDTIEKYKDCYMKDLSYLALLYQQVSKPDKSIPIYEELIKIYKSLITDKNDLSDIFYLSSIAELYIKLENKNEALETYKRVLEIYTNKSQDTKDEKERNIELVEKRINDIELGKEVETACIFTLSSRRYS
ncbi:hypothetical protein BRSU_2299 [Brachyspira suanatina]|uniref:Uncharacterized protein n=1 Tax=Brachyspira suanatina TaxID=381802 RepID=A0A0G4K9Q9_9SPIR|nr:tetratricopeptide repeat protein [Brachyspira suanatina]CRF34867.1 hypothetical protein BRSU_2299 [Brachyspira suanatina]